MAKFRTVLAYLFALAVAVAPVAAILVASARPASAATAHDCHRMTQDFHAAGCAEAAATEQHCHDGAVQDSDAGSCPDCLGGKHQGKCIGDGGKCCKLTGMAAVLTFAVASVETVDLAANPPLLVGWQVRPPAPPPRS